MEKAFPPVLSNLNLVVVVLSFGKKHCLLNGGSLCGPPIPPASGRHSHKGRKNGGLDLFKAAVFQLGMGKELLNDGFFSFAVVRQIRIYIEY